MFEIIRVKKKISEEKNMVTNKRIIISAVYSFAIDTVATEPFGGARTRTRTHPGYDHDRERFHFLED